MPIYRASVRITSPNLGGDGANIWHIRTAGGVGNDGRLNEAMGWIEQFYIDCSQAFSPSTAIVFDGTVTEIATNEPTITEGLDTFTVPGVGASGDLPPANALVVGWRTALANRRGRGRTFLGPLSRGASEDNGTPTALILEKVRDAAAALVASSTDSEVLGSVSVGVWSPTDNVLRDVTGASVRDRFAVLRSRRD